MKQLILAMMALSIVAFAPTGKHECKDLHDRFLEPARSIASFLKTSPGSDTLAGEGCVQLLEAAKDLPAGARAVRALAQHGVENSFSRCAETVASVRYPCVKAEVAPLRCLPEAYTYCGEWEYSLTHEPKYELAMELSTLIDITYDRAQRLCGMAMNWDPAAMTASRDLAAYLSDRVLPDAEALYGMSCEE